MVDFELSSVVFLEELICVIRILLFSLLSLLFPQIFLVCTILEKRRKNFILLIAVNCIKTIKKLLLVLLCIIEDYILDQLRPYLKVSVLCIINPFFRDEKVACERDHFV